MSPVVTVRHPRHAPERRPALRVVAGRYRLLRPLGHGGVGTVWLAHDPLRAGEVAVKEVTYPQTLSPAQRRAMRRRTLREARVASRVDHPATVRVYDVLEEDDRPYVVMEVLFGRTLAQVIAADGPLSPPRAAAVLHPVADALAAAHAADVVHRDVKPANIILCDDRRDGRDVVLTDFGIATTVGRRGHRDSRRRARLPRLPRRPSAPGARPPTRGPTCGRSAPRCSRPSRARRRSTAASPIKTVLAALHEEPAPFQRAGPLAPLIAGLLRKDPADRPPIEEVRRTLGEIADLDGSHGQQARGPGPTQSSEPQHDDSSTAALAAAGARRLTTADAPADDSRTPRTGGRLGVCGPGASVPRVTCSHHVRYLPATSAPAQRGRRTARGNRGRVHRSRRVARGRRSWR